MHLISVLTIALCTLTFVSFIPSVTLCPQCLRVPDSPVALSQRC